MRCSFLKICIFFVLAFLPAAETALKTQAHIPLSGRRCGGGTAKGAKIREREIGYYPFFASFRVLSRFSRFIFFIFAVLPVGSVG
jgi:hypothetical protein